MDRTVNTSKNVVFVLKALLISYIITAIMLLILSVLMVNLNLSSGVISGFIHAIYILSTFLGGFIAGKRANEKRYLWGLTMGVFYFIIIAIFSLLMNRGVSLPVGNLIAVLAICGGSGMIGGMLS